MELMPICGPEKFSYKYVNGHPNNPKLNKLTVVGSGLLAENSTGEPLLISEMTLLTGIRTGATSYLASKYLAPKNVETFGIIGCGSQSEFQVMAHAGNLPLKQIYYFDVDEKAMDKFSKNLGNLDIQLTRCQSAQQICQKSQLITTCTAYAGPQEVIQADWIGQGQHVNAIGGDSPGKTELDPKALTKADKLVVEFFPQTAVEGEIQNLEQPEQTVYAELWEIISGHKAARENDSELTIFDGVGFALEDYCTLNYVNQLSQELGIFTKLDMVPELSDAKDLFGLLS